jgi:HAD superfamily hydrolase (TIGR01490 family)
VKEFSAGQARVAAFFDLDGTLTSGRSLEWNHFRSLRKQGKIAGRNYLCCLREAIRLAPRGILQIRHANKMYLRGVASEVRMPAPTFLRQALDQVAWHARQGHLIAMVSGTLEPLAKQAAKRLEEELAKRGIGSVVRVFATRLEEHAGKWTGRIVGEAMIGEAKAEVLRALAAELNLNLARCYAYGDTTNDTAMLALVGRPATVNASQDLRDVARREGWAEISWQKEERRTQKTENVRSGEKERGPATAERLA